MVDTYLPFNRQTAHKLIQIGEHSLLSNVSRAKHLPAKWSLLHELTKIPDEHIEVGITEGHIHPAMRRDEIRELSRNIKGAPVVQKIPTDALAAPTPKVDDVAHADRVINVIASICGVPAEHIKAPTRFSAISSLARHIVFYSLCTGNGWTATRTALVLNRDRTSVEHGRDLICDLRDDDEVDYWIESIGAILVRAQELAEAAPEALIERGLAAA